MNEEQWAVNLAQIVALAGARRKTARGEEVMGKRVAAAAAAIVELERLVGNNQGRAADHLRGLITSRRAGLRGAIRVEG